MVKNNRSDREALMAAYMQESEPILADLRKMNIQLDFLDEIVNRKIDYRVAIPILVEWLHRVNNLDVKETLVRALTVKWAKPMAATSLINEFQQTPQSEEFGLKWTIGNALSVVADDSVFDEIVNLVRDRRHGRSREMLAVALGNMKDLRAVEVLVELLDDDEVSGHALIALRKLAPPEAKKAIEPFVDHPKTWIVNEAKRALQKIDNKSTRAKQRRIAH